MQTLIRVLLAPLTFALGFLWPLITQSLLAATELGQSAAILIGAVIATAFGLMAHLRGSWLWIK